jgi:hypothetical protein
MRGGERLRDWIIAGFLIHWADLWVGVCSALCMDGASGIILEIRFLRSSRGQVP